MKTKKLDYKKMVEDINELVDNDFVADMERISLEKENIKITHPRFSQDDAKEMAKILTKIYVISHAFYCPACMGKYEIRGIK